MQSPARSRYILAAIFLILLLCTPITKAQQTINVPAGQPTIQAAINAANNGDTVMVAPGTYVENINFNGKAITVTSSGGPSVTTIDGGANGSVVTFSTGETASAVLSGFTIRNGFLNGLSGGGIYVVSASPTITGNIITGNHAAGGCGIYVGGGSPLIQNNTITANDQTGAGDGEGGGGILISGVNSVLADPQIIGNTITNNSVAAGGDGGGIAVYYLSSPLIQENLIQGNQAYNSGGGVALQSYNSPVLVQNLIVNNTSQGGGSGGGLYVSPSDLTQIINNTIAANSAYDSTSAVYVTGFGQDATFTNNIFVAAAGQNAVTCNSGFSSISPVFSYNDSFSTSGSSWTGICDTTSNPGNISVDPLFMSPANNDFHLQSASPAIDAGNNSAAGLPNTDFDGNPRIAGAAIDLGVYEVVPTSAANISPGSLSFGSQAPGTTSGPQTATLTSTGTTPFQITSVQFSSPPVPLTHSVTTGAFSESTTCPTLKDPGGFSGISAGNSCTYSVTFAPPTGSTPGTVTDTLTVNGTNGASLVVSLSGTVPTAAATLSPTSLSFAPQVVGATSSAQSVTLTNPSNVSLAITSILTSQQFSESDNCGTSLAAGASCTINITFAPAAAGDVSGILGVTDNAGNSPQSVALSGTGLAPAAVSFSPSSLSFSTPLGTSSANQTITVTNTGGTALGISGIAANLPFEIMTSTCTGTLAGGASCSVNISFTAQSSGSVTGAFTITDNASGSPQSVPLTGTTPATVSFSPSSLAFSGQVMGTTSAAQTVTLTNTGGASLSISSIATSQPFAQTNNCSASLAGGASCTISVTFTPQSSGSASGVVSITDNASGSPQSVALSGTGLTPAAASLSASSLTFSGQVIGTTSAAQTVNLTNTGGASLSISSVTTSQPFAQTNNCPASLAGGASCTISVTFTPQSSGSASSTVSITDNASGSPQSITLSGTGLTPAAVSFSPSSLSFSTPLGTSSANQTITVTNTGGAALGISGIAANQPFAIMTSTCSTLAGGASCSVNISFTPQSSGSVTGAFTITDTASGSPQSVPLTGTTPAVASLSPSSLAFPATQIGATATQTVTLTNTGGSSMNISNLSYPNPFSVPSQNCLGTLAGGASCQITVAFKPTASGPVIGILQIMDTASGSPQSVPLSGTGYTPPAVSLSTANLNFGSQLVGTTSAPQSVTLTNTGGATLAISSIAMAQPFAQTNNCPANLAAGANCTISVTFTPQASGAANGTLTITDNASNSPQGVSVAGSGVVAAPTLSPTSLSFGTQVVGTTSGGKTVQVKANSPGPLAISAISVSARFTQTNNCPASLNPGSSCNISIAFQPTTAGAITGALTIIDNGQGNPDSVPLSGTGLDFSISAAPSSVTINSGAKADYTVTVSALGGSFSHNVALSCSGLPAQASCSFSPSGVTPGSGSINSGLMIKTTKANGTSGTQPGTYTITITGTANPPAHSTTVTLIVD